MLRFLTAVASVAAFLVAVGSSPVALPVASAFTGNQQQSAAYFVIGQVRTPGRFTLAEGMTVQDALEKAGGATERGALSDITILRIVDGERVALNARFEDLVMPDDTIYVPRASGAVLQDALSIPQGSR